MNKKNILKHFFIIGSGTAINMLIGLATTPLITRLVDPTEYGQLSIFTMYSNIALMTLCLGLDQGLVRYFYVDDSIAYKRTLLFKCVKLPIIVSCIFTCVIISISALSIYKFEFSTGIMIWLCIYTICQILYRFAQLIIRLQYKSKVYSLLNILNKIAYLLIAIPLIIILRNDYLLCLVIATTIPVILCIIVSIYSQKDIWIGKSFSTVTKGVSNKELLKYSAPFIISMGVTTLFQAIDKIFLNQYCSYAEVGIYSSTMTLIQIFAIVQSTFNTLWAPMQVEHFTKNPNDHTFYQKGNQIITVVMFIIGITLILIKDVFAILLGSKYREAAYILPFLIFNPIMYTISETTCGGLVFMKKSNMQVVVAIGACITNIIGNTLLVPKLGCQGAAISTGLSYIVFFAMRTVLSNKFYYTDFHLVKFGILTGTVCLYAFYNTFNEFNIISIIGWFICCFMIIVFYKKTVIWSLNYLKVIIKKK